METKIKPITVLRAWMITLLLLGFCIVLFPSFLKVFNEYGLNPVCYGCEGPRFFSDYEFGVPFYFGAHLWTIGGIVLVAIIFLFRKRKLA